MRKVHSPYIAVDVDDGEDGELVARAGATALDDPSKLSEVGAHPVGELHGALDRLGLKSFSLDADSQRVGAKSLRVK